MLINLVAWIYISFICLIWGNIFLSAMYMITGSQKIKINGCLICLAGLSLIGVLALYLSLLIPLDWKAHCIIVFPALCYCLKKGNRHTIRMQASLLTAQFSRTGYLFLAACVLMTLAISSYTMDHPDTIFYHARSILLFERYKPIPGIANLRLQLGFQSLWFASLAVFKWDAPTLYNVIFLNGTVLCWYFVFVIGKMEQEWLKKKEGTPGTKTNEWAWLLLLAFSLISWTQVRLTAASASPDFIITLYVWAAIFAFFQMEEKKGDREIYQSLVFLFCFAALLIKLSAIVLSLLAIVSIARSSRFRPVRSAVIYFLTALIILIPLFARNRIASGYLFYPSSFPDIFHADWKPKLSTIHLLGHYISMYARFHVDITQAELQLHTPFSQWIPAWWHKISLIDRLLIAGIILGIIAAISQFLRSKVLFINRAKQAFPEAGKTYRAIIFKITIAGSLLWFLEAPDFRFGTGFLIPLLYLLYLRSPLLRIFSVKPGSSAIAVFTSGFPVYRIVSWSLLIAVAGYSGHRFINFLTPDELIHPAGIQKTAYQPLGCEDLEIDLLRNKIERRGIKKLPCKDDNSGGFLLRGQTVEEGFKPVD